MDQLIDTYNTLAEALEKSVEMGFALILAKHLSKNAA